MNALNYESLEEKMRNTRRLMPPQLKSTLQVGSRPGIPLVSVAVGHLPCRPNVLGLLLYSTLLATWKKSPLEMDYVSGGLR